MFPGFSFSIYSGSLRLYRNFLGSLDECFINCQNDPSCKAGKFFTEYSLCVVHALSSSGYVTVKAFKKVLHQDASVFSFLKKDAAQDKVAKQKRNRKLVKGKLILLA